LKPFLDEKMVGDGFELGSFLAFVAFLGVIGLYLSTSLPMLKNLGSMIGMGSAYEPETVRRYREAQAENSQSGLPVSVGLRPTPTMAIVGAVSKPTQEPTPTMVIMVTATPTATPAPMKEHVPTVYPTIEPVVSENESQTFLGADLFVCHDCAIHSVTVRLTYYWPNAGTFYTEEGEAVKNCWDFNEETQYCDSPMYSGLPWEPFVGLAAACPFVWPIGTIVTVPNLGMEWVCLDRGTMVCAGGVCEVDLLLEQNPAWNNQTFPAEIKVPGW
jgi:hypothetical protein